MLMIRFQRIGRTNDPAFRIVVLEKARAAKSGRILEQLGTYNPRSKAMTLDEGKAKEWIGKGAQPTGSVHNLFITKGLISGKKVNVLPSKKPSEKAPEAAPVATAAPAAVAAPEVAPEAAEEPAPEAAPAEEAPAAPVEETKAEEPAPAA